MNFPEVPGFQLVEFLGEGFGGTVYRGVRESDESSVAVKVLTVSKVDPLYGEKFNRMIREAEIYAVVRHPNLVPFLGHSLESSPPFLVFEVLAGGDLTSRVRESGPLNPEMLRQLGERMAAALSALHTAGIVHRDVKASNVLLGEDGAPFLCDMGIGHVSQAGRLTASNVVLGTPGYLAPEVLAGGAATPQSDLYSLGILLAFAATGVVPSRDDRGLDPRWEDGLDRSYAPLLSVLRLCLRDHPDHRPADAEWVVERLRMVDLKKLSPAPRSDETATQTFEFATSDLPVTVAPSPAGSLSGVAPALPSAPLSTAPPFSNNAAGPLAWRRTFAGALLGMLAALAWHAPSQGWFSGRLPEHERGLPPASVALRSSWKNSEVTWERPEASAAEAGLRLVLETAAEAYEYRVPSPGATPGRSVWDAGGAVLELGEQPRWLVALDPTGALLWFRELRGEWRLHPGWVSVQIQGTTTWIERQTGRILGP